jgi:alkylation response protein AidB-like acyl-CoA dehydrogenase
MGYVFRTEEQQGAVDGLRRYLADKADPLFNKEYRDRFVPKEQMGEFMRELSQFGLISGVVGEEHGGLGLDWLTMIMLFEEVAATSIDLSVPVLINSFCAQMVARLAPAHLRERYLPGLLKGELFCSAGISEPDVGSNVLEIKTRAKRDGDHFIINGEKTWISNGSYSDILIVTCRTGDENA